MELDCAVRLGCQALVRGHTDVVGLVSTDARPCSGDSEGGGLDTAFAECGELQHDVLEVSFEAVV